MQKETVDILAYLARLQAENTRLKAILRQHGIAWEARLSPEPFVPVLGDAPTRFQPVPPLAPLSSAEKIALFKKLFRGRTDVYPQRWESQKGASGYSPVCDNEWHPEATARVILATGRLIGEGFDHSPLNTMVLAMPISWQGTLRQYAGRLHREHADKTDIRIYDYVESGNPQLYRMWKKRRAGYVAMGYQVFENQ